MRIHEHFESPIEDKISRLPHLGTQGTWNLFGVNLPDFSFTEALGLGGSNALPNNTNYNNPAVSNLMFPSAPAPLQASGPLDFRSSGAGSTLGVQAPPAPPSGGGGGGDSELTKLLKMQQSGGLNPPQQDQLRQLLAQQQPQQVADPYAQVRSDINSVYDAYLGSLDQMLNQGLPSQRSSQEGVARGNFGTNQADLSGQLTQGLNTLGGQREAVIQNQAKNLRELAANMRNSFLAGNIYLGSQGAGDSSAANQYSYALTQLGNKQRGDITSNTAGILDQINSRESNLQTIYNTETNKLKSGLDAQIAQIGSWFADAQNQLRQAQASGQLNKSQDLANLSKTMLNQALNALNSAQQQAQQRSAALDQWAMNNSQTIQGLKQNFASVAQFNPTLPTAQPITGTPSIGAGGAMTTPIGYGSTNQKITGYDIFGRPQYAQ